MRTHGIGCTLPFDGLMILTSVLVVLKAFGKIDCSWWLVLSPVLMPVVLVFVVAIAIFLASISDDSM